MRDSATVVTTSINAPSRDAASKTRSISVRRPGTAARPAGESAMTPRICMANRRSAAATVLCTQRTVDAPPSVSGKMTYTLSPTAAVTDSGRKALACSVTAGK